MTAASSASPRVAASIHTTSSNISSQAASCTTCCGSSLPSDRAAMTPVEIAVEVAGWAGASLILLGYLLITAGKLTGQSAVYQWMNVAGAAGFIVNGWWHGAIPSAALNVVWMLIGAVALLRIAAKRRRTAEATE